MTVTDVAPAISIALGIDTLFETETFSRSGSFTDPGTNSWTAAVNWQDGTGDHPLTLTAKTFALSHQYGAGAHSVSGKISDGHVTSGGTAHPVVLNRGGAVDYIRVQASVALSTLTLPGGFAAQVDQKPQAVHHQIALSDWVQAGLFLDQFKAFISTANTSYGLDAPSATRLNGYATRLQNTMPD